MSLIACEQCGNVVPKNHLEDELCPNCRPTTVLQLLKLGCANSADQLKAAEEITELRSDWSYEKLRVVLRDEVPLTMLLGLVHVLVDRMVREHMFLDGVNGVVEVVRQMAKDASAKS